MTARVSSANSLHLYLRTIFSIDYSLCYSPLVPMLYIVLTHAHSVRHRKWCTVRTC